MDIKQEFEEDPHYRIVEEHALSAGDGVDVDVDYHFDEDGAEQLEKMNING